MVILHRSAVSRFCFPIQLSKRSFVIAPEGLMGRNLIWWVAVLFHSSGTFCSPSKNSASRVLAFLRSHSTARACVVPYVPCMKIFLGTSWKGALVLIRAWMSSCRDARWDSWQCECAIHPMMHTSFVFSVVTLI